MRTRYLLKRKGSDNWYVRLQPPGQRLVERSLGTPDKAAAELAECIWLSRDFRLGLTEMRHRGVTVGPLPCQGAQHRVRSRLSGSQLQQTLQMCDRLGTPLSVFNFRGRFAYLHAGDSFDLLRHGRIRPWRLRTSRATEKKADVVEHPGGIRPRRLTL